MSENENKDNVELLDIPLQQEKATGVSPTNLEIDDIHSFGQEGIPNFNMNRISASNIYENNTINQDFISIGKTPDGPLTEKLKKHYIKPKTVLFLVVVFLIIGGLGFGIYFFLNRTKTVASLAVTTKDIEISIGEKPSLDLDSYATFKNVKATNCILDLQRVDINKPGKYDYYINCGVNKYLGHITVVDKNKPSVTSKMVVIEPAGDIKVDDFIISCEDESECHYELVNFDQLKEQTQNEGQYLALINVTDDSGNLVTIKQFVLVTYLDYSYIVSCTNKEDIFEYEGNVDIYSGIIFDSSDNFVGGFGFRNYSFKDDKTIDLLKERVNDFGKVSIDGFEGTLLNDDNVILYDKISSDIIGDGYFEINDYYISKGYSCVSR